MAMSKEDNELLTRVGPGTPMGSLLRQYWVPAIRGSAVEPEGAPQPVRLFGEDFVVFRTATGAVGILEEACPHRGVSMLLARNEEEGLRCIFHGWKFDVRGTLTDAPCEPANRRANFCSRVVTRGAQAKEIAGIVWAYVGTGEPPPFPAFEFNCVSSEHVCMRRAVVPYNWLQGLEAHIDSSHVPFLHSGFLTADQKQLDADTLSNLAAMAADKAPRFELVERRYGLQESALRDLGQGSTYARVREIALPFATFIPGPADGVCGARLSVPIDDETSAEWYIVYHPSRPLTTEDVRSIFNNTSDDEDDFAANMGNRENRWHQDRAAMKNGHFSGLTANLSFEDFIVQASMGRRYDRSREQLSSADLVIVNVRRILLNSVKAVATGVAPPWRTGFDYSKIRARSVTYGSGTDWRAFVNVDDDIWTDEVLVQP